MLRSLWTAIVDRLVNVFGFVRDVNDKSNEPNKSNQSNQSNKRHQCTRNHNRTCNCNDGCPDDDGWVIGYTNNARDFFTRIDHARHDNFIGRQFPVYGVPESGLFPCPVDNRACGSEFCEGGSCKESVTRSKAGKHWSYAETAHDCGIDND